MIVAYVNIYIIYIYIYICKYIFTIYYIKFHISKIWTSLKGLSQKFGYILKLVTFMYKSSI